MSLTKAGKKKVTTTHHQDALNILSKEETSRVNAEIPADLHHRLRVTSTLRKEQIKELAESWIRAYIARPVSPKAADIEDDSDEPTSRLSPLIPEKLHREFSALALKRKDKIQALFVTWIKAYLKKHED